MMGGHLKKELYGKIEVIHQPGYMPMTGQELRCLEALNQYDGWVHKHDIYCQPCLVPGDLDSLPRLVHMGFVEQDGMRCRITDKGRKQAVPRIILNVLSEQDMATA